MPFYLDDEPISLPEGDLGAVLDGARRLAEARERIIVEVSLDGRLLAGQDLEQSRPLPVSGAEVRLTSADPRELAVATLAQLRERLEEARGCQLEAADLLQRDLAPEAIRKIGQAMGVWLQTQQGVATISRLLRIDLDKRRFEGRPITEVTGVLITRITALRDMINAHDTVALADTLGYEWSETTDQWQRLIDQLATWVTEG